ncbi:hypothetical protein DCD74_12385 [Lysobacter oculi]|uniref:Secreted protein n=1 Tax=Solilutibacter oculi TaxID=2698682 RepID=A0A344J8K0_9GAMM|nr:hypothetical protein [Lysobacter oculi]AXA85360.1 hypothetical protein DCD74_12385 [Lysobacter oculi]
MRLALLAASFATFAFTAHAAEPQPEIQRAVGAPQAVGALHTLRVIPEACARIQGKFTGNSAKPYDFAVVQTGTRCQPRAKLVDAAKVKPQGKPGWIYADLVRVPSAACASQQAVVRLWRHDAKAAPPQLDAQGRSRLYLKESVDAARQNGAGEIPVYAVEMGMAGKGCG